MMKLYGADNAELMQITAIERVGNNLAIKGKIFGAMLRPEEVLRAMKLLDFRIVFFLIKLCFRRATGGAGRP